VSPEVTVLYNRKIVDRR